MELIVLAVLWLVINSAIDAVAVLRGRDSPRMKRRREQHELDERYQQSTGKPTIRRALAGRIADRLAAPRGPGAFRRFLNEAWEDGWVDASDWRRARRERRRRRAELGPDADEVVLESRPCPGGCEPPRWLAGDLDVCSECVEHRYEWPDDDADDDIVDAEIVEPDPHPEPVRMDKTVPTDQHDPEPNPAPATNRKDTPMTAPVIISGDIGSPQEALGFCDGTLAVIRSGRAELDTITHNLAGEGVGDGPLLDCISTAMDNLANAELALVGATTEYEDHVTVQAELLGNPELRATLRGYLASRRGA